MSNSAATIYNPDSVLAAAGGTSFTLHIAVPVDADGDPLTITLDSLPTYGTVEYFDGAAWQTATAALTLTAAELANLRYTPPASGAYSGEDLVYTVDDGTAPVQGTIHMSVVGDAVAPGTVFFSAQDNPSELNADLYAVGPDGVVSAHPISAPDGSLAGVDGGYVEFGGNLYFNAFSAASGFALFRLDATGVAAAVDDGSGGYIGHEYEAASHFTEWNGSLYFRGDSQTAADQVIRLNADGSSETIVIQTGGQLSFAGDNGGFTPFDGGLWFSALTGGHAGADLIRLESNGTFADISTRASGNEVFGSSAGEDGGFIVFNNALYFNSYSDTLGDTLFRVDAGSTTPVVVDPTGSALLHLPTTADTSSAFHVFNGSLWFNEFSVSVGDDTLFQLDTAGSLTPFTFNGEALRSAGALGGFADFAGSTYFVANTSTDGTELFALDTSGNITRITDTTGDSFDSNLVSGFAAFDGALYFDAYNGPVGGDSLFKLDSLGNLTTVDLGNTIGSTTLAGVNGGFQESNGSLYFSAYTPNGDELVRLDGDGTVTAYDLNPGAGDNSFAGQNGGFGVFPPAVHDGTPGDDILVGGKFGETLNGNDGNDVLYGRRGNDTIHGGAGNDAIRPGPGADHVYGEDGDDLFILHASLTPGDTIDGGAGYDTLSLAGDYSFGLSLLAGTMTAIEAVVLHAGFSYSLTVSDANVAAGENLKVNGSHLLSGDSLQFSGSAEQDGFFQLTGGAGDDNLTGGAGNDTLRGADGNDILRGGQGGDTLIGGLGADSFVYNAVQDSSAAAFDSIKDFDASTDSIDLWFQVTGIDATQNCSLSNLANKFDAAHLLVHHAALASTGSHTFLVVEANGVAGYQAGQDLVIKVDGMTGTLDAGDFV